MPLDLATGRALEALVQEGARLAQSIRATADPQLKGDGSIVTRADREVETLMRQRLPLLVPETTVWGEEEGFREPGPGGLWAVDPVDGTSNYTYGSSLWGVSVGLIQGDDIPLGAIVLPDLGWSFMAVRGQGAFLNGQPLPPLRSGEVLPQELVSYSDNMLERYGSANLPGKMRYVGAFVAEAAYLFTGVFRGVAAFKARLYDMAPTFTIAGELGADIRYLNGDRVSVRELVERHHESLDQPILFFPPGSTFRRDRTD